MRHWYWLVSLVFLYASTARVKADQTDAPEGAIQLTIEELSARPLPVDDLISLSGKYLELQDNEVVIFGCSDRFQIKKDNVKREVLAITALSENITLTARCIRSRPVPRIFEVEKVSPAPPTQKLFEQEIKILEKRGPAHARLLFQLARRIHETEKSFKNPELHRLAWRACMKALLLRDSILSPSDIDSRLDDVREMHEIYPDRALALHVLATLEGKYPKSEAVRQFLRELNCRKYRGRWMTYEKFKALQGYEYYKDRWVSREEKDFLRTIEAYLRGKEEPILRRRLDREYEILSSKGRVAVGMKPREVFKALGYPDRVYRKIIKGNELDQWVYGDRYYYLLNNLLIKQTVGQSSREER